MFLGSEVFDIFTQERQVKLEKSYIIKFLNLYLYLYFSLEYSSNSNRKKVINL